LINRIVKIEKFSVVISATPKVKGQKFLTFVSKS